MQESLRRAGALTVAACFTLAATLPCASAPAAPSSRAAPAAHTGVSMTATHAVDTHRVQRRTPREAHGHQGLHHEASTPQDARGQASARHEAHEHPAAHSEAPENAGPGKQTGVRALAAAHPHTGADVPNAGHTLAARCPCGCDGASAAAATGLSRLAPAVPPAVVTLAEASHATPAPTPLATWTTRAEEPAEAVPLSGRA